MKQIDNRNLKLHMRFDKPFHSSQGMAVWEDYAFQLYHTGQCAIYDLKSRDSRPLTCFPLGSANEGNPSPAFTNHANQCMFSNVHRDGNPVVMMVRIPNQETASRFGIAEGQFTVPGEFDSWDEEISEMFEETI